MLAWAEKSVSVGRGRQVHHPWANKQLLLNNSSSHRDKVELVLLLPPQREFQPQHGLFFQSLWYFPAFFSSVAFVRTGDAYEVTPSHKGQTIITKVLEEGSRLAAGSLLGPLPVELQVLQD